MNLIYLTNYFIPIVMAGCLSSGYIIKKWIKDIDNKLIPTIMLVEGAIINCIISGISLENIIIGSVCGLASTGLHQAFTRIVEGRIKNKNNTELPK